MAVGPVLHREWVTLPRRSRTYLARAAVAATALVLMSTAWQVLAGTQTVRNIGDLARFGAIVFPMSAALLLTAVVFLAALSTAASVAYEKDRRTFDLLLLTNLSNTELVLGKLFAGLLGVANLLPAAGAVLMLTALMGGVGYDRIVQVLVVASAATLMAGSLGSTIALWREKTFQTLAATTLALATWTGVWELVDRGLFVAPAHAATASAWATAASPWHAVAAASRPSIDEAQSFGSQSLGVASPAVSHLLFSLAVATVLNGVAIWRVRVWNPTREIIPRQSEQADVATTPHAWSLASAEAGATRDAATGSGSTAVAGRGLRATRTVWDNPVLWREVCTWAYGRRVLLIRFVYVAVCGAALWSMSAAASAGRAAPADLAIAWVLPAVLGLLLINMQAVTALTAERDARALDLLLVTDITPKEFVFGKLAGILYNVKEMVLLPLLMGVVLWQQRVLGGEAAVHLAVGWTAVALFAAVLGIHVGMHYAESRRAVAVSLGTVFFLVVGVAVSMRIMVAFSGSFQAQLQPFLATIVGGGVGLYAAMGRRNPSPAITLASFALPLATFYAITSYLVQAPLAALLAVAGAYGFATTALLVPAVFEFDVATGRATGAGEEA